jgi:5-methylcytosine-specific restriction endonuclease McrBC GTP-binding regulatory subunit McrB
LVGFYDLFCSQVKPSGAKTPKGSSKASVPSAVDEVNTEAIDTTDSTETVDADTCYDYESPSIEPDGENLIIYGTPGCGKSHELANRLAKEFPKDNRIRVTFHQDYTYTDFVGQILPMVTDDNKVRYEFIPGPFTLALEKAIECKGEKVALVIEEINRGNAPSIFGDLFQLLDREAIGTSVYPLTNIQITQYLQRRFPAYYTLNYIKIPANLSLFATMNTGDQNVFTLDTAFKRRWNFEKLSNKFKGDAHSDRCIPGMSNVTWENFVTAINEHMIKEGAFDSEDKQLGKYFITYTQLVDLGENDDVKTRKFAYKVLEYLWNDVAKFDRERWFNISKYKTLDSVIEAWTTGKGKDVFNNDIIFVITPPAAVTTSTSSTTASDPTEDAGKEE